VKDPSETLIVKTGVAGRGVFALQRIAAGEEFLRYTGPKLTYVQTTPQTLAVQVGPDVYLGASGGFDDFVNHSCHPNAGLRIVNPDDVTMIALRDIEPGEEIYFDYSTTMDEDDFEMTCRCGHLNCRGLVRDFKHLPGELKRQYDQLGIVPAYNRRHVPNADR
jgi:SET domain-containing protein